jgi:carboxyl-terminal processing protease
MLPMSDDTHIIRMVDQFSKYKLWQPFLLGLSAAIGLYAGLHIQIPKSNSIKKSSDTIISISQNQKLSDVLAFVHAKYIDSISTESITDQSISGLLNNLDPYSGYYTGQEAIELADEINGNYNGVGIQCLNMQNKVYVARLEPKSPAEEGGIKIGDQIISIDGNILDCSELCLEKVIQAIRESKDTVQLTVLRNDVTKLPFAILKKEIQISSLGLVFNPTKEVLYVKLKVIGERSFKEFMDAVEYYKTKHNCTKMILDLRDNSGGLVHVAADILNQLVEDKE